MKTSIDIHNYEEYFLLYVDGELSASDRSAVDAFVLQHPHLAQELDMLQQAVLGMEELVFADKEALFRNGAAEINTNNCEEQFLLYVDNELDKDGREKVETFVLQHPVMQESFLQLKQARLEPETVVFPYKASLYRREEKERRVVFMYWKQLAVAAAFIGLVLLVWQIVPAGSEKAEQPVAQTTLVTPVTGSPATEVPVAAGNEKSLPVGTPGISQNSAHTGGNLPTATAATVKPRAATEKMDELPAVQQNATAQLQPVKTDAPAYGTNNRQQGNTMQEDKPAFNPQTQTQLAGNSNAVTQLPETIQVKQTQEEGVMAMTAQPAVYRELDTEEGDDKKSLYLGSIEINKDKLRGFFRKASSLFRGKAKEEEKTETTPSHSRSLR